MAANLDCWERADVVGSYYRRDALQLPEERVLELLGSNLSSMDMLDVGVGGGRTTVRFAPLVKSYIGIDYSSSMIAACRKRFAESMPRAHFEEGDATCMNAFGDDSFDFVLFSYNGIDYVSEEGRAKVLCEVTRVLRGGGYFCFSTHNILWTRYMNLLRDQWTIRPNRAIRNVAQWMKWWRDHGRYLDRTELAGLSHAIINDGAHDCSLRTYYVNPSFQVENLNRYFRKVTVVTLKTGDFLEYGSDLTAIQDPWLYYLCHDPIVADVPQSY